MKSIRYLALATTILLAIVSVSASQEFNSQHHDRVNSRGDHAMGFSHKKTVHHFRLLTSGGAIEVSANDPKDTESRDQIRRHLEHISKLFAEGDFTKPMFTHDTVPPGVPVMTRLKSEITYKYEKTDRGGRVLIITENPEALAAIYDFLRFQIQDHRTGDSLEVESKNKVD